MIPFLIYYSLLGIEMDLERRLEKRYNKLVRSHMSTSDLLSPGVKASLGSHKAFSETQGAWRFYNNERCRLNVLAQPMLNHAQTELEVSDETYGLYPSPLKVLENFSEMDYNYRHYEISAAQ